MNSDRSTFFTNTDHVIEICFYLFVFFLPLVRVGIPLFQFDITTSDFFLLIAAFLTISKAKIASVFVSHKKFFTGLFLLLGALTMSIVNAKYVHLFFFAILPYIYLIVLSFTTIQFFSFHTGDKAYNTMFFVLLSSLLISFVPSYYTMFFGKPTQLFYMEADILPRYYYLAKIPNQYGIFAICSVVILFFLSLRKNKYEFLKITFWTHFIGFPTYLETGSKAVLVMAILLIPLLLYHLFLIIKLNINKMVVAILIVSVLILLILFLGTWHHEDYSTLPSNWLRSLSVFSPNGIASAATEDDRINQLRTGIALWSKHPLFGIGLGNYIGYAKNFEIHNYYMAILVEAGLVGLAALFFFILYAFYPIWHLNRGKEDFLILCLGCLFILFLGSAFHTIIRERWGFLCLLMFYCIGLSHSAPLSEHNKAGL
jgi:O-antigen ligase